MSEWTMELAGRLVVGRKRDGRCIYDAQAKRELILACREPGVSMAKLARECGINANQLSSWVRQYERATGKSAPEAEVIEAEPPAFVPVQFEMPSVQENRTFSVHILLPNGASIDLRDCDTQQACSVIEAIGRLRCSASTKA
ncbi:MULTISPECIES: IS66 family insertion sequence element accessory protein TnpA [unclassified Cupriavidus]|uniref:IS66 family insertion sequence element accessory protein TnpA n=2 Tax=Burkholderiaceae TaxID=119060 RepID=UPI000579618C|nr:transposase [Cupriavidus sp. TKC]